MFFSAFIYNGDRATLNTWIPGFADKVYRKDALRYVIMGVVLLIGSCGYFCVNYTLKTKKLFQNPIWNCKKHLKKPKPDRNAQAAHS
jgi:hypothetical protein